MLKVLGFWCKLHMVIIVGAGLVGAVLAIKLAQFGINVKLLEKNSFEKKSVNDGRTIAVTLGSKRFLASCGLWEALEPSSQRINNIRVFEQGSAWTLDYDHKDLGSDPMGYIIKFEHLRDAIYEAVQAQTLVELFANCTLQTLLPGEVHTKEYGILKAPLVVGADGRQSWVRSQVNIRSRTKEYGHKALVAHFIHEKPHQATAWEVFHSSGPFAMLPMTDTPDGNYQSGIVWCGSKDAPWETLPTDQLESQLENIFPFYGKVTLNSQRWTFPITSLTVDRVTAPHTVLVGDAAHALHPIAGQGVHLGWRDVADIAQLLVEAKDLGQDLGSELMLAKYSRMRKPDHKGLYLFTDGLTRLYGTDNSLVSFARQTGLAAVGKIPFLKKILMKKAMGI